MKVIVTRPARRAARTVERLEASGHTPLLCPLFEPSHDEAAVERARNTDAQAIVVTSSEALRALQTAGSLAALPIFAVGSTTAAFARSIGFEQVEATNGNAMSLAEHLVSRFADATRPKLLYLAGEPRMPHLEQELTAARFRLELVICYRMQPVEEARKTLDEMFAQRPDAVLLYSSATARRFLELAEHDVKRHAHLRLLCLSKAIAAEMPPEFAGRTLHAQTPQEADLLALL